MVMQLSSCVVHRGDLPTRGHYQAILHLNEQLWMADDNGPARLCDTGELDSLGLDAYLLFYVAA